MIIISRSGLMVAMLAITLFGKIAPNLARFSITTIVDR